VGLGYLSFILLLASTSVISLNWEGRWQWEVYSSSGLSSPVWLSFGEDQKGHHGYSRFSP